VNVPAVQVEEVVTADAVDTIAATIVVALPLPVAEDMEATATDLPLDIPRRTGTIHLAHEMMCIPLVMDRGPGGRNMFPRGGQVRDTRIVLQGGRLSTPSRQEKGGDARGTNTGVIGEVFFYRFGGLIIFL
jgi:hypothetical protein